MTGSRSLRYSQATPVLSAEASIYVDTAHLFPRLASPGERIFGVNSVVTGP